MITRIEQYNRNTYSIGLQYGSENNKRVDKLNAFLLVLSPILQHYKGIYKNAGFTVIFLVAVISIMHLFTRIKSGRFDVKCLKAIVPLLIFQVYKMVDHSISVNKLLYGIFMLIVFIAIACGSINIKYIVKYATIIGSLAAICLIIQYIFFYFFKQHIIMVPFSMLLPESDVWIMGVQTGLYGLRGIRSGFYRPSAFFLEPSHLFIYCFPMLCINLFQPAINNWRKRKAILLSLAMILSTSGMGIMVTITLWIIYFALYGHSLAVTKKSKLYNLFNVNNILFVMFIIITILVAYFLIPIFRNSVLRIFGLVNGERSSAIDGRTRLAKNLVYELTGKDLFFGVTDNVDEINFNLPGFYATLYKNGIIGVILSYFFYIRGFIKLKDSFFWLNIIIVMISFFTAHTHGTFYMLYYVVLLINGYHHSYQQLNIQNV